MCNVYMASDTILERDPRVVEFEKMRDVKIRINHEYYPELVDLLLIRILYNF